MKGVCLGVSQSTSTHLWTYFLVAWVSKGKEWHRSAPCSRKPHNHLCKVTSRRWVKGERHRYHQQILSQNFLLSCSHWITLCMCGQIDFWAGLEVFGSSCFHPYNPAGGQQKRKWTTCTVRHEEAGEQWQKEMIILTNQLSMQAIIPTNNKHM